MDSIRATLDELMGKDRDLPLKEKLRLNKHFDHSEVCKYYLLDFCPHDLFPNTKSDLGPCKKRHDQFFKQQFMKDINRESYQVKYEEMLMDFLEELIAEVDNKMKRSFERIEAPLPDTEKPRDLMEQIRMIDNKIQELVEQAEKFGEMGRIDESEIIMRQIDRLKESKNEYMIMSEHPLMAKEKQMKVCEVCGAMQSLQDNEKRLQTHMEGKLHTGYLKIREHLDILRRRKLDRKLRQEEEKDRERIQREMREKERLREMRDKERKKKGGRSRSKDSSRSRSIDRKLKDLERREIKRNDKFDKGGRYDKKDRKFERSGSRNRDKSRERSRERSRDRFNRFKMEKERDNRKKKRKYSDSKSNSRY